MIFSPLLPRGQRRVAEDAGGEYVRSVVRRWVAGHGTRAHASAPSEPPRAPSAPLAASCRGSSTSRSRRRGSRTSAAAPRPRPPCPPAARSVKRIRDALPRQLLRRPLPGAARWRRPCSARRTGAGRSARSSGEISTTTSFWRVGTRATRCRGTRRSSGNGRRSAWAERHRPEPRTTPRRLSTRPGSGRCPASGAGRAPWNLRPGAARRRGRR